MVYAAQIGSWYRISPSFKSLRNFSSAAIIFDLAESTMSSMDTGQSEGILPTNQPYRNELRCAEHMASLENARLVSNSEKKRVAVLSSKTVGVAVFASVVMFFPRKSDLRKGNRQKVYARSSRSRRVDAFFASEISDYMMEDTTI